MTHRRISLWKYEYNALRYSEVIMQQHHKKIRDIGAGIAAWESFNFVYDFLFFPFAVAYWGALYGGGVASAGAFIINAVVFYLYDRFGVDWLGAHALRQLDLKEEKSALEKMMVWLGKKKVTWWEKLASPIVFVALTLPIDPLIVAIHHRKHHFTGVTRDDWKLLFFATAAANAWWLLKVEIVIEGIRYLGSFLSTF